MSEYEIEPVRGLPEALPSGECILWQGAPDGTSIAWRTLQGRLVAVYFVLLAAMVAASSLMRGGAAGDAAAATLPFLLFGSLSLALLRLIGWLVERTTVYTVTNRRVAMRFGIALPLTLNIPFEKIASAEARLFANGIGDISLHASEELPLTYFHLWPHTRGMRLRNPEPALRCIPEASAVAAILVRAVMAAGVKGEVRAPVLAVGTAAEIGGSAIAAAAA